MARPKRRRSDRALRARMHSPGRPTVARREDRQRFWAAIAKGLTSEDAAIAAGVSPVVADIAEVGLNRISGDARLCFAFLQHTGLRL